MTWYFWVLIGVGVVALLSVVFWSWPRAGGGADWHIENADLGDEDIEMRMQ